ncbi:MAG: hypothetical protein J6Q89_08750 [Clostridia bacterium]|nr:hypothetical protein [Clostridia bacterium]
MEFSMAIRTQESRPLEFRGEPVTDEIDVVELQLMRATTNITRRIPFHQNFFDGFTPASEMSVLGFDGHLTFTRFLFHNATSLKVG